MEKKIINSLGRITKTLIDEYRTDYYSKEECRKIPISIFYPSFETKSSFYSDLYFPRNDLLLKIYGDKKEERIKYLNNLKYDFSNDAIGIVEGTYKVIVFSHGLTADRDFFMFLIEPLVKRGYICITVGHLYDTDFTLMPDTNEVIPMKDGLLSKSSVKERLEQINTRALDIDFVLRNLENINKDKTLMIYKSIDLEDITLVGHSLGAMTVLKNIANKSVKNIILLDGAIKFLDLIYLTSNTEIKEKIKNTNLLNIRRDKISYGERLKAKISNNIKVSPERFKNYILKEHEEAFIDEENSKRLLYLSGSHNHNFIYLEHSDHLSFTDYYKLYNDKDDKNHPIDLLHDNIITLIVTFIKTMECDTIDNFSKFIEESKEKGIFKQFN